LESFCPEKIGPFSHGLKLDGFLGGNKVAIISIDSHFYMHNTLLQ
jgi:hypothetical protein